MSVNIARAQLLLQQGRYELAEKDLRQALAANPEDDVAHALLAICLPESKKFDEALESARKAVGLAPDHSFCHYALAYALFQRDDYARDNQRLFASRKEFLEAEAAVREAIRLSPHDVNCFALLSSIRLARADWAGALQAATQGLEIDPLNVTCTNCRATALVKLGRNEEAGEALDSALAEDPEDSHTHANKGWALLHQRKPYEALEHFKEALRIDPSNEYARAGIVEALKARNFIYRWMLAYFLWMSRLSGGARWGIILGGYFLVQMLGRARRSNPALEPYVLPIQLLYALFVILSWTAHHLFNLLLRLDKHGRYALSRDQIMGANCVGACIASGVILIGAGLFGDVRLVLAGMGSIGLMIPVGGTFTRQGRARKMLGLYTLGLLFVGLGALASSYFSPPAAGSLGYLFVVGLALFGWIANVMSTR